MSYKLIFIASAIWLCSCRNQQKIKPSVESISESVYAAGIIKAKHQYEFFSTVSGLIDTIMVSENDMVKVGTPLLSIAHEATELNKESADLQAAFENMAANKDKLAVLENDIEVATRKYHNDSLLFKRQQILWNEHIGSKVDLEHKELEWQNSTLNLQSARIKYHTLFRQLRFTAQQSENYQELSHQNVNDFTIKSQAEGKVYSITKKKGEIVNPQVVLGIIGDADNFIIELQIDEYDIVKIKKGQRVFVSMDSYKGEVFEAEINKIYPIMNDRTKSFLAEAFFLTEPPALYPNLNVETNILIRVKKDAIVIPRSYLINDSVVLTGISKMKTVITGLKDYDKVEVVSGLTTNDYIYKPE